MYASMLLQLPESLDPCEQVAQHMNGVDDGWQPLQRGRMASMQPLIEKGTPPPRPSRPPPPPPSELDLLAVSFSKTLPIWQPSRKWTYLVCGWRRAEAVYLDILCVGPPTRITADNCSVQS